MKSSRSIGIAFAVFALVGALGTLLWPNSSQAGPQKLTPPHANVLDSKEKRMDSMSLKEPAREIAAEPIVGQPMLLPKMEPSAFEDTAPTGSCSLHLSLVIANTETPTSSYIWLFRLDAPETRHFTRGDQLQAMVNVPVNGKLIKNLPEGEYRVAAFEQPRSATDADSFFVRGDLTTVQIQIQSPRQHPVKLAVYDEGCKQIQEIVLIYHEAPMGTAFPPDVSWTAKRDPKNGAAFDEADCSLGDPIVEVTEPLTLFAEAGIFEIGHVTEPTRGNDNESWSELGGQELYVEVEGEFGQQLEGPAVSEVVVVADWETACRETWVAVQVPIETIASSIRLPDGKLPNRDGLSIDALCYAQPIWSSSEGPPCDFVELEINVTYPGHDALRFEWTPAEGELATQYLARKSGE